MAALDSITSIRYEELCRLCAVKSTLVVSINIFENEGSIRELGKKIPTCLPIQLHETDHLPKMICENCLYKVELFYEFREKCISTERLLIDLLKEIHHQQSMDVLPIDHSDLIMVQHNNELINVHSIDNVTELNLSQLIKQEIILSQHNVDMNGHSLDSLPTNHELTSQDLSNHSLHPQESLLVETSNSHNSLQSSHFSGDNLDLIHEQHQLLTEQFRLQNEIHVNMSDNSTAVSELPLQEHCTQLQTCAENPHNYVISEENSLEKSHIYGEQRNIDDNSTTTDSQINVLQNQDYDFSVIKSDADDVDSTRADSDNENCLLIDEQLKSSNKLKISNIGDKKNLLCNICSLSFITENEFQEHCQSHSYKKCLICAVLFINFEALSSHMNKEHGEREMYKVEDSNLSHQNNGNISRQNTDEESGNNNNSHVEDGDSENNKESSVSNKKKKWSPKVCKECGKTYKTNYKLTEHMRKHTGEKPYKCSFCEKAFRSKIGLAQHEAKHTGKYAFSCTTCGKGFQCKSYLMVHQRVHSDLKPYPCTTCGQNFKTKQSLLDHTNRHLGVKPYICDTCGRGFITKGLCEAHQKIHTGLDNRKYSCKLCEKMFVSKSYLQTHLKIHTGEKPFMCEVCGKGFLTRVDLRIHSTMHTGEKSFVCEICGKAFARRDALRCHRRSHTGERPYSCDICGQTFTQFTPMAIHKRLHTGERPYTCETCGKAFVSRSTMMSHARKHR